MRRFADPRRLLAISRALAVWFLAWRILPRLVHVAFDRLLGPPPPFARHGHVLVAGALIRNEIGMILATLAATAIVMLTENDRVTLGRVTARSNLPTSPRDARAFPIGMLAGFVSMAAIVGTIAATGHARLVPRTAPLAAVLATFSEFGIAFLLVGLAEEVQNRGYVLRALSEGIGFWAAAAATSIWFGALHLSEGDPWAGAIGTGLRGVFDCLTWRITGSLAFAIGFHAAWDGTQTALLGVPDSSFTVPAALLTTRLSGPAWLSGGSVGPEGSLPAYACTALLIAGALVVLRRHDRPTRQPFWRSST